MNNPPIKLIIGLGNIGSEYEFTRHNVGFLAIDKIKESLDFPEPQESNRFKALISQKQINKNKITLAKPTTFMNSSGESAQALSSFYKIKPQEILVIQDDLDLELGEIREKYQSSSGGHNGIQSIIDNLGTKDFYRIKIGISSKRPSQLTAKDFVLQKFNDEELKTINEAILKSVDLIKEKYLK